MIILAASTTILYICTANEIDNLNQSGFNSEVDNKFISMISTPIYRKEYDDYHDFISTNGPFLIGDFTYSSNLQYEGNDYFLSVSYNPISNKSTMKTDFVQGGEELSYYTCPIISYPELSIDINDDSYLLKCSSFDQQLKENEVIILLMADRIKTELNNLGLDFSGSSLDDEDSTY